MSKKIGHNLKEQIIIVELVEYSNQILTSNEGINQRDLKFWANMADKICFGGT